MPDSYSTRSPSLDSPARRARAVTPADGADLPDVAKALYIGVTGDVKVTTVLGDVVTFKAVPVGALPIMTARVWSTGTTATDIVALFD